MGIGIAGSVALLVVGILGGFSGNDEALGSLFLAFLFGLIGGLVGALI